MLSAYELIDISFLPEKLKKDYKQIITGIETNTIEFFGLDK